MFSRLLTKQNSHIIRSMHFVYANMNAFFSHEVHKTSRGDLSWIERRCPSGRPQISSDQNDIGVFF